MIVLQGCLVFIYMCLVPYLIGRAMLHREKTGDGESVSYTLSAGLMVAWAIYELLALAMQKMGYGFRGLSMTYLLITVVFAMVGTVCVWKEDGRGFARKLFVAKRPDGYMIAALVMILVQIGAILIMATPDMDDAFYSGLSSISLSKDCILEWDAYDGRMQNPISRRYMISALPIWQASLSLGSGFHHLVITHNLFPLFYMPLAYGLYYCIGKRFLQREGNPGAQGKFMFFFALMHMIGNYYVFSPENFLVTRMWQGKALFAAVGIPTLWICGQAGLFSGQETMGKGERIRVWILPACALLACTFMGETGLFLGPFLLGCQTLAACMVTKKWKKILPAVLCCVPEVLLFVIYLL